MRRCLPRLRAFLTLSLFFAAPVFGAGPPPTKSKSPPKVESRAESRAPLPPFREAPEDKPEAPPLGGPAVPLKSNPPAKAAEPPPPAAEQTAKPTSPLKAPPAKVPPAKTAPVAKTLPPSDNRPASDTPVIPGVTYSNASEIAPPGSTQPPAALGAAPYDLGAVRRLQVGGTPIVEPPLRVGNLDLLGPLVEELPLLGATVTRAEPKNVPGGVNTPTQDQFFQINLAHGAPIVLTIGKSVAWIDNNEQTLRAAPLIIGDQIWLPIFSIAPLLGAAARLDDLGTLVLTPTIQSVELFDVNGTVALTIKTSAPLAPGVAQLNVLKGPDRIYIDFPGYSMGFDAGSSTIERMVAVGTGDVLRARAGMPSKFPDTTRITLDLKKAMVGQLAELPDKTLYALVITQPGEPVRPETPDIINAPIGSLTGLSPNSPNALRGMTIVVDAGHGGKDSGARGSRALEKDHALDIARRLRRHLEARGATVLMSRDSDTFISLQGRVDFANSRRANLFVSVHINASVNKSASGTETYYYTAQSQALAREVHKELVKSTGLKDRGLRQARFFVVRKTWMPSILTECAYISNAGDEAMLAQATNREKIAAGISRGVTNYVSIFGRPGVAR